MPNLNFIRSSRCESHACLEVAFQSAGRCETANCAQVAFHRSSRCEHAHCVEVGATTDRVYVRDSKDLSIPPLAFDPSAWRDFTAAIKAGDL